MQFTSWALTDRARAFGLVPSMGSIGDWYDNAVIESFSSRGQAELLNRQRWRTRIELANALFEYRCAGDRLDQLCLEQADDRLGERNEFAAQRSAAPSPGDSTKQLI